MLRFSNFARALRPVAGRGQESHRERRDDGNVAGVFQTGVYQRRRELCFGLCQRARSLSPYIRLDLSVCGPRNVVGGPLVFLVPLGLLLHPSEPPSPYLSLTNIASLRVSLAVSPFSLSISICLSSLVALPLAPATREAKRRLFRRECFRRNAETVLIAARLA